MSNRTSEPRRPRTLRLSGTRPLTLRPDSNLLTIGERTNVTGSRKFARLIKEENYEEAVEVARWQVAVGRRMSSTSTWTRHCSTAKP